MVNREEYLKKLLSWKDEQVIKVVSGIRRCGKSTLLKQFIELLQSQGIDSEQIIYLNLEEIENDELYDYKSLYNYITERLCKGRNTYILTGAFDSLVTSFLLKKWGGTDSAGNAVPLPPKCMCNSVKWSLSLSTVSYSIGSSPFR